MYVYIFRLNKSFRIPPIRGEQGIKYSRFVASLPSFPFKSCIYFSLLSSSSSSYSEKVSTSRPSYCRTFVICLAPSLSLSSWPEPLPPDPPLLRVTRHFSRPECRDLRFPFSVLQSFPRRRPAHLPRRQTIFPGLPGPIIKIESSGRGPYFVAKINWRALIVTSRSNFIPSLFYFISVPLPLFFLRSSKLYIIFIFIFYIYFILFFWKEEEERIRKQIRTTIEKRKSCTCRFFDSKRSKCFYACVSTRTTRYSFYRLSAIARRKTCAAHSFHREN